MFDKRTKDLLEQHIGKRIKIRYFDGRVEGENLASVGDSWISTGVSIGASTIHFPVPSHSGKKYVDEGGEYVYKPRVFMITSEGNVVLYSWNEPDVVPGIYQHYKSRFYLGVGTFTHSETLEAFATYVPLYPDWRPTVRPLSMFNELVSCPEYNYRVPRFNLARELTLQEVGYIHAVICNYKLDNGTKNAYVSSLIPPIIRYPAAKG